VNHIHWLVWLVVMAVLGSFPTTAVAIIAAPFVVFGYPLWRFWLYERRRMRLAREEARERRNGA
jgi:hypothetical protein